MNNAEKQKLKRFLPTLKECIKYKLERLVTFETLEKEYSIQFDRAIINNILDVERHRERRIISLADYVCELIEANEKI